MVNPQKIIKKPECELEKSDQEVLKDQNYVEVLGRNIQGIQRGTAFQDVQRQLGLLSSWKNRPGIPTLFWIFKEPKFS